MVPIVIPIKKDIDCAPKAASKDIRAPEMTRANTLLPSSSVPKIADIEGDESE